MMAWWRIFKHLQYSAKEAPLNWLTGHTPQNWPCLPHLAPDWQAITAPLSPLYSQDNCQLKGVNLLERKVPSLGQSPGDMPAGQLGFCSHLLEKQLRAHLWGLVRISDDAITYGDSVFDLSSPVLFLHFTQQGTGPGSLWNWNSLDTQGNISSFLNCPKGQPPTSRRWVQWNQPCGHSYHDSDLYGCGGCVGQSERRHGAFLGTQSCSLRRFSYC